MIKRTTGPNSRSGQTRLQQAMEGKTLAEKLAQAKGDSNPEAEAELEVTCDAAAEVEPASEADSAAVVESDAALNAEAEVVADVTSIPAPDPADVPNEPVADEIVQEAAEKAAVEDDTEAESGDTDAIVQAAKAMRDATKMPHRGQRLCLIVDDSRVIRKVSSKIAKSLGYIPIEAENGEEALARCKKSMPNLVLTDWNMPEMDGIEFVRQLRAIPTPNAPTVVFCTSNGEASDIHEGIGAGADDYIVKPFDEPALRAKLEQLAAK